MTRPYAEVIGDPIAHSKSPTIHNFWLAKLGIDADYRPTRVTSEDLPRYLANRRRDPNWRGCNVTSPLKINVLAHVNDCDSSVTQVGAANCIAVQSDRLVAFNTDVDGVDAAIPNAGKSACIIGAGGAARAAIASRIAHGVTEIRVIVRDPVRARAELSDVPLQLRFVRYDDAADALAGVHGVINASPLGTTGKPKMHPAVLENLDLTDASASVFDMVYSPLDTALLAAARAAQRTAIDGLVMLVGQASGAFSRFFGHIPDPHNRFQGELRALLTS